MLGTATRARSAQGFVADVVNITRHCRCRHTQAVSAPATQSLSGPIAALPRLSPGVATPRRPQNGVASRRAADARRHVSTTNASSMGTTVVPSRTVIRCTGPDTFKMLNALVTTNATKLTGQDVQYCAFLNPQGRILATAFVFRVGDDAFVDVDANVADELLAHIKKFKLRSKVKLSKADDEYAVVAAWGESADTLADSSAVLAIATDPRSPDMGRRAIVIREAAANLAQSDSTVYTLHRMLQGVVETSTEIVPNHALPLEANVELAHGVDFRKGCYVGQELTARTHHTGVIRKRIVPVAFFEATATDAAIAVREAPTSLAHDAGGLAQLALTKDVRSVPFAGDGAKSSRSMRERSAGKIVSRVDNVGLALLRLDQAARWGDELAMRVSVEGQDASVWLRPFVPAWWPDGARNPE